MTDKLKPCPFCQSTRVGLCTEHDTDGMGKFVSIKCQECMGQSAQHFVSNGNDCPQFYQEVRESWNRRTEPAGSADHIGGVNEMVTQSTHTENVSIKAVEIDLSDAEIAEIAKRCEKANLHYTLIDFARAVLLAAKGWE